MIRTFRFALAGLMMTAAPAFASPPSKAPPSAPSEVTAAAPSGTALLSFASSGEQPNADAAAIFETAPDKDNVRHRTLVMFGKKDGKFVPDFSNDKVIACSQCSQFHDDPFDGDYVKVTPGHAHIEQIDSGEKSSTTVLDLVRRSGKWQVTNAIRTTVVAGRGPEKSEKMALPASGLAADMDGRWTVPVFLNTLLVNHKSGKFMFMHGNATPDSVWKDLQGDCNKQDCTVLVQQQDGCISLVRDSAARSFGGAGADSRDEKQAVTRAMTACTASGGQECKEVRTDCSKGF